MMHTVGVDIIEVQRIAESLEKFGQTFLDRIFTKQEQEICAANAIRLAGRFAVKEAVGKALGTGIGDARWIDIEIINDDLGRPVLLLHAQAKEIADSLGLISWSISMSHTKDYAVGMAVAMPAN